MYCICSRPLFHYVLSLHRLMFSCILWPLINDRERPISVESTTYTVTQNKILWIVPCQLLHTIVHWHTCVLHLLSVSFALILTFHFLSSNRWKQKCLPLQFNRNDCKTYIPKKKKWYCLNTAELHVCTVVSDMEATLWAVNTMPENEPGFYGRVRLYAK